MTKVSPDQYVPWLDEKARLLFLYELKFTREQQKETHDRFLALFTQYPDKNLATLWWIAIAATRDGQSL